jgi:DHA1 family multidrug resistance protein-like MFS transporter
MMITLGDKKSRTILESFSNLRLSAPFLVIMTVGYGVYAIDRVVLSSVLAPLQTSLSLSNTQIGLLTAAIYIGVTCVVFVAGHLSDKYGRWPVVITGIVIFSAFTWLMGLSTNFYEAFAFRFISGVGEGVFWPVAMASVANYFKGRKGLALGIFYVGFDAGSVAGVSIGGIAYAFSGDNWRPAFFVAPLIGVFVIGAALVGMKKLSLAGEGVIGVRLGRDALQLLRKRNVLLIMVFALLATWQSVWQTAYLPYYFFKAMHFTVLSSAGLTALVLAAGMLGKIGFGGLSDSIRRNRLLLLSLSAILVSYAIFFSSVSYAVDLLAALSMGFFNGSIFPVMQSLMADSSGGKIGSALGLSTTTQSIATVFSTIVAASLFSIGLGKALALDAMIPAALAILVVLALKETRQSPQKVESRA